MHSCQADGAGNWFDLLRDSVLWTYCIHCNLSLEDANFCNALFTIFLKRWKLSDASQTWMKAMYFTFYKWSKCLMFIENLIINSMAEIDHLEKLFWQKWPSRIYLIVCCLISAVSINSLWVAESFSCKNT